MSLLSHFIGVALQIGNRKQIVAQGLASISTTNTDLLTAQTDETHARFSQLVSLHRKAQYYNTCNTYNICGLKVKGSTGWIRLASF